MSWTSKEAEALKPGVPGPGVGVAVEESRQGSVGTLLEQKAEGVKARDEKKEKKKSNQEPNSRRRQRRRRSDQASPGESFHWPGLLIFDHNQWASHPPSMKMN